MVIKFAHLSCSHVEIHSRYLVPSAGGHQQQPGPGWGSESGGDQHAGGVRTKVQERRFPHHALHWNSAGRWQEIRLEVSDLKVYKTKKGTLCYQWTKLDPILKWLFHIAPKTSAECQRVQDEIFLKPMLSVISAHTHPLEMQINILADTCVFRMGLKLLVLHSQSVVAAAHCRKLDANW